MKPHLIHIFPAFATGGPEVRTALLLDASHDRFRHTVLALNGDLSGRCRVRNAGEVKWEPAPDASPRGLARLLERLEPGLLLTYGWGGTNGLLAARLAGWRRVVHTEDGFLPDEAHGQKLKRLLARRVLLRVARRLVVPSLTLQRIARRTWWLPAARVTYIPNGVDVERFVPATADRRAAIRRQLHLPPDALVVGTVGHLRAEKNQARLIRAFAHLARRRTARLLIVGDGPAREDLLRQARELGLADAVHLPGVVQDPLPQLQALDLFALSSDTEQMPIAVLEAMAAGLPIVSTDVGDTKSMLSEDNRPFVSRGTDESAFTDALLRLAEDPTLRCSLGAANRELCTRRYGLEQMVDAYLRLYAAGCTGFHPAAAH